jgi:hypothetical protein
MEDWIQLEVPPQLEFSAKIPLGNSKRTVSNKAMLMRVLRKVDERSVEFVGIRIFHKEQASLGLRRDWPPAIDLSCRTMRKECFVKRRMTPGDFWPLGSD